MVSLLSETKKKKLWFCTRPTATFGGYSHRLSGTVVQGKVILFFYSFRMWSLAEVMFVDSTVNLHIQRFFRVSGEYVLLNIV